MQKKHQSQTIGFAHSTAVLSSPNNLYVDLSNHILTDILKAVLNLTPGRHQMPHSRPVMEILAGFYGWKTSASAVKKLHILQNKNSPPYKVLLKQILNKKSMLPNSLSSPKEDQFKNTSKKTFCFKFQIYSPFNSRDRT